MMHPDDIPRQYFAFISYKREDEAWARRLQRKLEYYRMPSAIRKTHPGLPESIRPVFKDTTDLEPGALAKKIRVALDDSRFLIVICSPRSARSEWVSKEAQAFIDSGRTDHIIPFIIDGEPNSADPAKECFPDSLRALKGEQELLGVNINEMGYQAAVLKVIARMFGLRFDTLWQRHERDRRRRQLLSLAGVAIVAAAAIAIASYIWRQNVALDSANTSLADSNHRLELAYNDLEAANDSVERAYSRLRAANDSLDVTNLALGTANRNLAAEKNRLQETNEALFEQITEAVRTEAAHNIENGNVLGALRSLARFIESEDFSNGGCNVPPHIRMALHQAYDSLSAPGLHSRPIGKFKADTEVADLRYSRYGKYLVYVSANGMVGVIDIDNHYRPTIRCQLPTGRSHTIDIHPTLNQIAVGGENGSYIIDINGAEIADLGRSAKSIRYSLDGRYLASADNSGITIYNARSRQLVTTVEYPKIKSIDFDSNSNQILIATHSHVRLYDWQKKEVVKTYSTGASHISHARFSIDHSHIIALESNNINIYGTASGEKIKSYYKASNDALMAGNTVMYGFRAPLWKDITTGDTILAFAEGCNTAFTRMEIHPAGNTLAAGSHSGDVVLYSIGANSDRNSYNANGSEGCTTSPDHRYLVNCLCNGPVAIFDTSKLTQPAATIAIKACSAVFMPDSKSIVAGQTNGHIGVWNTSGHMMYEFTDSLPGKIIQSIAVSHDGSYAYVAADSHIYKYDVARGKILKAAACGNSVGALALDSTGKRLLSSHASNPQIRMWNTATMTHTHNIFPYKYDIGNHAIWSPDDKFIAMATYNKDIRVLDVESGTDFSLSAHDDGVQRIEFIDNNTLLSLGSDHKLIIWDLRLKQPRHIYHVNVGYATSCRYIPGVKIIVASGSHGSVIMPYPTTGAVMHYLKPYL